MDEYISRNELLKAVQSNVAEAHNERCAQLLEVILNAPTADVVPKSEVERLKAEKDALIKNYAECMKDYASEIFAEIEFDIRQLDFDREETRAIAIEGIIAKAKKKYTEKDQL